MKLKTKRSSAMMCACLTFLFSGCSNISFGNDSMLRPPRATGDKAEIQEVISKEAGGRYTLKYPQNGDNRSAIIMHSDGKDPEYALALYSVDKDPKINMSVISSKNDTWSCIGTVSNACSDIDRVLFKDISGDKKDDIIVGLSTFNSSQKKLTAYSLGQDELTEMKIDEYYDEMVTADIINENEEDILLISLSTKDTPSMATLLQYSEKDKRPVGRYSLELDSDVVSFSQITVGNVAFNTALDQNGSLTVKDNTEKNTDTRANVLISENAQSEPSEKQTSDPSSPEKQASKPESSDSKASKPEGSEKKTSKQEGSKTDGSKPEYSKPEASSREVRKQEPSEPDEQENSSQDTDSSPVYARNNKGELVSELSRKGVVLDCVRKDGTKCTQIIYYDKLQDELIDPLAGSDKDASRINFTIRTDDISAADINNDGIIDFPYVSSMMAEVDENGSNVCSLTSWNNYDAANGKMKQVMNTVMNIKDGYFFILPERWNGKVTARSNTETREMTFYLWNSKTLSKGDMLLSITRFTDQQWNDANRADYVFLGNSASGKVVYAARIFKTSAADDMNIEEDEIGKCFRIL